MDLLSCCHVPQADGFPSPDGQKLAVGGVRQARTTPPLEGELAGRFLLGAEDLLEEGRLRRDGFCRTPAGFPCQRGFGLQKPRLPAIHLLPAHFQGSHAAILLHDAAADIAQRAPRPLVGLAFPQIEEHCRYYCSHDEDDWHVASGP